MLQNIIILKNMRKAKKKDVVERLRDDLYVDDLVSGCAPAQGKILYIKSNAIMNDAGFDLRKWVSNDRQELGSYTKAKEREKTPPVAQGDDMTYFECVLILPRNPSWVYSGFVFCFGSLAHFKNARP